MASDNPLLTLFKGQLEAECNTIASDNCLVDRGHFLIYWYFMRLYEFNETEVEEVICDGGGDLGIDAIWIDDDDFVHFFQFKNPEDPNRGIPAGDIDRTLCGIRLIMGQQHERIANPALKAMVQEIYQGVRAGYQLHLVSSGRGIQHESEVKLNELSGELSGPSSSIFDWKNEDLAYLQDKFYQQNLPAIEDPITFESSRSPYMLRSGDADSFFLHATGRMLADLYGTHGESLLQRNIRVDQKNSATNRSIAATCSGEDSASFLHFNNGVTFLCESANHDGIQQKLTLYKAQVVNGGQTMRALCRAWQAETLKDDVLVPVRAITTAANKDFANNVAVNQNNQNQMGTGFLRSNDPRVIQLDYALASLGWYLERREGEVALLSAGEISAIERRIGHPLASRVIKFKEGAQAYVATFYGNPELAKKNAKKIFTSTEDGGSFERIFNADMTASKIAVAHQLKSSVDEFVRQFNTRKRRRDRVADWKADYADLLGKRIVDEFPDVINQFMPQCAMFLCGTIFKDYRDYKGEDPIELPGVMAASGPAIICEHVYFILDFARRNQDKANKSWPGLLKSNTFFHSAMSYIQGIRTAQAHPKASEPPPTAHPHPA